MLAMRILMFFAAALLVSCAQVPDGVQPVENFDTARYLGKWYEIARLDHRFERGLTNVTATYTARDDDSIGVLNRGFDPVKAEWSEVEGRAKLAGAPGTALLKVSFFGPFYGAYNVVDLDADYQVALVAGPNRSYLWILARRPDPPREAVERVVRRAGELGFDTAALIFVTHDMTGN